MADGDLNKKIEGAKETMGELLFATRDFSDEVKKSAKEVFGIGTSANSATKAFRDIGSSLRDMSSQMDNIVKGNVTVKDLAKEQEKYAKTQAKFQVEYSQALNKANSTLGKNKISQEKINGILHNNLSLEEAFGDSVVDIEKSSLRLLESFTQQAKINTENDDIMSNMADRAKKIEKGVGLAGAAFGSMGTILEKAGLGNIGSKMGLDVAVKEGRKLSAELTKGGEDAAGMGTKLRVAGKMAATIGKNLLKSFGPLALIGMLIKEFIADVQLVDEAAGKHAKTLGISHQQALKLGNEYREIAASSEHILLTGDQIAEAQGKLNEKFQTGGKFSAEISADFADIQKRTGLSDKSMGFLVKGQIKGKKTMESQLATLNKTVVKFNIQNKMVMNVNKVMEKISKASKSIHLFTKGNVAELAKTAMLAQKFGAEMSTIEGIGSSLLDFESSIAAEMEAELLLGKDINLEKARGYALAGNTAKLTEELMGQKAIMKAFDDGNVLSQEAAAKAIGLTRDQLAEIVMSQKEQQALQDTYGDGVKDVTGAYEEHKEKLQPINDLIAATTDEKEKQILLAERARQEEEIFKELGNENLQNQMESLSAAEVLKDLKAQEADLVKTQAADMLIAVGSMNDFAMKIKDALKSMKTFAMVLAGVYGTYKLIKGMVWAIQTIEKVREGLAKTRELMASGEKVSLLKTLGIKIGKAVMSAFSWLGPIGGAIAAASITAMGTAYMMSDGVIGPGGEMVVSGPKGSIQLDKEDSLIAGTNLGGKGNSKKSDNTSINNNSNSTPPDNSEMLGLLKQIANKSTVIEMGGNEVGQGINTAEREIQ